VSSYDLNIDAGATFEVQFEYTNDDGTLFNLTGWTAKFQARENTSSTVALEITPTIVTATAMITLHMTAAQTATLTKTNYVYAIELTKTGAETLVIRLVEGEIWVSPEIVK
jgi:hypothetical protein